VLEHYERQTDDEAVAEDESGDNGLPPGYIDSSALRAAEDSGEVIRWSE
jgi:hypothetical protein